LPEWVATLQMAEEWGTPPWAIEDELSLLWSIRWQAWKAETSRATRDKRKHG
jgi:hypothetical protein